MKKLVFLFTSLFVFVVALQNVNAQKPKAVDGDGTATAKIITPIAIEEGNSLSFGSIASGTEESTVKISTEGNRTLESGDATLYTSDAGQTGTFDVTGAADHTYSITLPANGVVSLAGDGSPMAVKDFDCDLGETGLLGSDGKQTLTVGATLVVGDSQASGEYSGTYVVTVNYN